MSKDRDTTISIHSFFRSIDVNSGICICSTFLPPRLLLLLLGTYGILFISHSTTKAIDQKTKHAIALMPATFATNSALLIFFFYMNAFLN